MVHMTQLIQSLTCRSTYSHDQIQHTIGSLHYWTLLFSSYSVCDVGLMKSLKYFAFVSSLRWAVVYSVCNIQEQYAIVLQIVGLNLTGGRDLL
jgi:hypothetical protein